MKKKVEITKQFIILDLRTKKVLYGKGEETLKFSSFEIAEEVAKQFYGAEEDYLIIHIT